MSDYPESERLAAALRKIILERYLKEHLPSLVKAAIKGGENGKMAQKRIVKSSDDFIALNLSSLTYADLKDLSTRNGVFIKRYNKIRDGILMISLAQGNLAALNFMAMNYHKFITSYIRSYCKKTYGESQIPVGEDCTNAAWGKLLEIAHTYDHTKATFSTWFVKIIIREISKQIKTKKKKVDDKSPEEKKLATPKKPQKRKPVIETIFSLDAFNDSDSIPQFISPMKNAHDFAVDTALGKMIYHYLFLVDPSPIWKRTTFCYFHGLRMDIDELIDTFWDKPVELMVQGITENILHSIPANRLKFYEDLFIEVRNDLQKPISELLHKNDSATKEILQAYLQYAVQDLQFKCFFKSTATREDIRNSIKLWCKKIKENLFQFLQNGAHGLNMKDFLE